jgi:cell division protein FtsB
MVTVQQFSRNAHNHPARLSPVARRWLKWGLVAVLFYLFVSGNMGAWNLISLWRTEQALERRESRLMAEIITLDTRRHMLENDTTYIERIARTEYNLSRPDETIYIVDELAP